MTGDVVTAVIRRYAQVPLLRNAYALAANTAITSLLGFAFWIAAARLYRPEAVGTGSAMVALMMLLSTVAQLNLVQGLARFLPTLGGRRRAFICVAYTVCGVLAVAVVGGLFAVVDGTGLSVAALPADGWGRMWFTGAVVVWTVFSLQDGVLAGLRGAVWLPVENATFGVLKLVLLVAFAATSRGVFAAWTLPLLVLVLPVNALIFGRLLRRPEHGERDTTPARAHARRRAIVGFVAGDYVGSLFALASTMLLPPLVLATLGATATAYFYAAWTVVFALETVALNFATSLTVEGAIDQAALTDMARSIVRRTAGLYAVAVPVLLLAAPLVLGVYGRAYADGATPLLRVLALGVVCRAITAPSLAIARVGCRVGRIVAVEAALGALIVGLSLLLVPALGLVGVGLAYAIGQAAVALALVPSLWRFVHTATEHARRSVVAPSPAQQLAHTRSLR